MAGAKLGEFKAGADFDTQAFWHALSDFLKPLHFEASPPFLVGWYNGMRTETAGGTQSIDAPDNAVAFALCSVPGFLDVVVEHFARVKPEKNYVDSCTNEILGWIRERLSPDMDPLLVNTDDGPPYIHIQTVGAVAGMDQHMEASDLPDKEGDAWQEDLSDRLEDIRDPKMWGTDSATRRKIFGVNVHPVWGGWYAYRGLLVLRGAAAEQLKRPEPLAFCPYEEGKRIMLEYNLRHDQCFWRDLNEGHDPEKRYKPEEYFFFMETSGVKRKRYLEIRAALYTTPPDPRVS